MNNLAERIEKGRKAITLAKAQGRDTTAWEKRLAELEKQAQATIPPPVQSMPAIPPPPADPLAEAKEVARRVREHGICLVWEVVVNDFIAYVRNDFTGQVPPGFVIYTEAELRELHGKGQIYSPADLCLIHEAKKRGGKIANG